MKTRLYPAIGLSLAIAALIGVSCTQPNGEGSLSLISTANAEPTPEPANSDPVAPDASTVQAPTTDDDAPPQAPPVAAPVAADKKLPTNVKQTGPAAEVMKLAQAGVDDEVMLNYIKNSTGAFSLTSDDIVYLNDLGVGNTVITAMMQHDQGTKSAWANTAPAPAPAAAPAYNNPPQPEPQSQPQPPPPQTAAVDANVSTAPPSGGVTYNYFYDSLSPYGTWVDVDGYGRCWQPTVAVTSVGWQPYSDRGHWVYTDSGWYWMSDYSWGWAPFHYGRWFRHARYGWCWWPDRVWGPSWVSWRYSDDYCGWAPLPPAAYYRPGVGFSYYGSSVGFGFNFGLGCASFTFVSWNHFCDPRPYHHRIDYHHSRQIYNRTTIVNNITTINKTTIVNRGVPVDRVRERTHNQIREVAIRDSNGSNRPGDRHDRFDRDGKTLVVNRPRIPESATPKTPTRPSTSESRRHVDSSDRNTPVAGAGARSLMDNSRDNNRSRERETTDRSGRIGSSQPNSPTSPAVTPSQNANRGNERPREVHIKDRSQVGTTSPSTVTGRTTPSTTPSQSAQPARRTAPPLVVIGRKDQNNNDNANRATAGTPNRNDANGREAYNTHTWTPATSGQQNTESPRGRQTSPTPAYTPQAPSTSRYNVRDDNRPTPSAPSYSTPRQTPSPSYSAPRQSNPTYDNSPRQSYPSQSYNPARQATPQPSAPSYSAPRSSPSPAPSYSAPSRSQGGGNDSRSSSGRDNGGGNGGGGGGRNRDR